MTTLREAAQQALEAMEYHVEQTRSIWKTSQAIDALRDALAQETQTPCDIAEDGVCEVIDCCRTELRRLHADAERYRYLRNRNPQEILPVIGNAAGVWIDCDDENGELTLLTGEDADAAIDAAMGKT
jgi:hypothetical protein